MPRRLHKTTTDYVVAAVTPALLIGLITCLVHFLLLLVYQGQHAGQLRYVLFFFSVGAVLIARISMMAEIAERAAIYGTALAGAMILAVLRFVDLPPNNPLGSFGWVFPVSFVVIIWVCAHALTWDCTHDEDSAEPDDGGLLATTGLFRRRTESRREEERRDEPGGWFAEYQQEREAERRRLAPGTLVIYFSLAALPLFGFGQALIPASQSDLRQHAFWLLTGYVGCGLGLLLTTSFLGLRRYLRQRKITMPMTLSGLWLGIGVTIILGLLLLATFLPRPAAEYSVAKLLGIQGPDLAASPWAIFRGSGGQGDSNGSAPSPLDQPGQDGQNTGNNTPANAQRAGEQPSPKPGNSTGKGSSGQGTGQQRGPGQGQAGSQQATGRGQSGDGQKQPASNPSAEQRSAASKQNSLARSQANSGEARQSGNPSPVNQHQPNTQDRSRLGHGDQQKDMQKQAENTDRRSRQSGPKQDQQRQPNQEQRDRAGRDGRDPDDKKKDEKSAQREAAWPQAGSDADREKDPSHRAESQSSSEMATSQWPTFDWLKWLIYIVLGLAFAWALWRHGPAWWRALCQIFADLGSWWRTREGEENSTANAEPAPVFHRPKPFASFSDPFERPGNFRSLAEMTRYSFDALQSWAYEQDLGREPDETPHEFAARLSERRPRVQSAVKRLAELYGHMTYAPHAPPPQQAESILRHFWQTLPRTSPAMARESVE